MAMISFIVILQMRSPLSYTWLVHLFFSVIYKLICKLQIAAAKT